MQPWKGENLESLLHHLVESYQIIDLLSSHIFSEPTLGHDYLLILEIIGEVHIPSKLLAIGEHGTQMAAKS